MLSLRPPTPADYAQVASWIPDAHACLRWAGPRVPFPFSASELPQLLAVPGGKSYCLADGGSAPLGFGQHLARGDDTVHLLRLIVSPTRRGQGLGRELCTQLMSLAIEATGAGAVTLAVYRDNVVAVTLYASLGFSEVESKCTAEALFMSLPSSSAA